MDKRLLKTMLSSDETEMCPANKILIANNSWYTVEAFVDRELYVWGWGQLANCMDPSRFPSKCCFFLLLFFFCNG